MRQTAIVSVVLLLASAPAVAATLQIDDNGTSGEWDYLSAVQTGSVGATDVEVTSTAAEWESNGFTDGSASYSAPSLYGTLAQPSGTIGDLFNQQIFTNTGAFTWTVTFLDPISDPVFYFGDADFVGATLTAPSGYAGFDGNSDFSKSGDIFSVLSGVVEDTAGAFFAIYYDADYLSGDSLVFSWDYTNANKPGGENIGLGIATYAGVSQPPSAVVPLPASGWLLLGALGGFAALRRRK